MSARAPKTAAGVRQRADRGRASRRGARRRAAPTVNLALQGGGSHGAFTWGVLDRLLEDGRLGFEGLSGASAGAMNAVVMAHGWAVDGRDGARAALERFWRAVGGVAGPFGHATAGPWADLLSRALSPYQFNPINLNPLRTILEEQVDFARLRAGSPLRVFVSATHVRSGHVRIFSDRELSVDALLASACLPTVFHAVEIDGEPYWDGGYVADPPLFPFFYECVTSDLLLVMVNPLTRDAAPRMPMDILDRVNEISFNASLIAEMRAIAFVQKLIGEDWLRPAYRTRLKDVRVHLVRADGPLDGLGTDTKLVTALPFLLDLRDRGRQAAEDWLAESLPDVGVRSSVDVRTTFLGG